ncbi:hypothetical protein [Hyphomonas sp.]|uniref:hypothetical protein n=1 Tax=Hyphomonas sp. TaxID=87 RepID=UPI00391A0A8F
MMMRLAAAPAFALILAACSPASAPEAPSPVPPEAAVTETETETETAGVSFAEGLSALCGQSFEGRVVSDDPMDDEWRANRLVVHVRDCAPGEFRLPLSVGEDRSRTWVLTTMGEGGAWELRHIHLHEDGSPDALTMYGGYSISDPDAWRQEFPADQSTKDLFDQEGIPVSKDNIWAMEVRAEEQIFAYELSRPNRLFRVEVDLSRPVETPPAHWGEPAAED